MRNKNPTSASTSPSRSPQRHTFSVSIMEENVETAEYLITKYDNPDSQYCVIASLFTDNNNVEAKQYLQAVKNLHTAMNFYANHNNMKVSEKLVKCHSLMKIAIKRLQKEFYQVLKSKREYLSPESVTSVHSSVTRSTVTDSSSSSDDDDNRSEGVFQENEIVGVVCDVVSDLKAIAECMISVGYGKECFKIYKTVRKSIVDETLYNLGVEKLSFYHLQKLDWDTLELKIKHWLNAVKFAVNTLFSGERILCEHVFASSSSSVTESCFAEITKDGALRLFSFPENVGKCKTSPEKMFRILDLYEAIANNWAEIEFIFAYESTSAVRSQALNSLIRLADSFRTMLVDFESAMQKDPPKAPFPGGGVHPLTRYVMNYIAFLADYSEILADIVADWPMNYEGIMPKSYFDSSSEPAISVRLAWLILVLLCKIDGKAELYKDSALAYLFLANNIQYVVVKVRNSNLRYLLGEEWIAKHDAKVKQYAANFERIGWSKVVASLPSDIIDVDEAKEGFGRFNSAFEEVYRKQSTWVVHDSKLREHIKVSLAKKLAPVYTEFYDKYRFVGNVKYAPEDLGNYLSDLFYGTGGPGSVSSSSSSPSHSSHSWCRR